MKKLKTLMMVAGLAVGLPAWATNVAVVDSAAAINNANVTKSTISSLDSSLSAQRARMTSLRNEITALQQRFEKDGRVMSETDRRNLQNQAQGKLNEYNSVAEGVQRRMEEAQSNLAKTLQPRVDAAIEELRKQGNYDLILDKRVALYASPTIDLTKQLTDRINQAR